jgi:hypothetical protein
MLVVAFFQDAAAGAHGRRRSVKVQRRRGSPLDDLVFVANDAPCAIQTWRFAENGDWGTRPGTGGGSRPDHDLPGGRGRRRLRALRPSGLLRLHHGPLPGRRPFDGTGLCGRFPGFSHGFGGRPAFCGGSFPACDLLCGAPAARRLSGAARSFRLRCAPSRGPCGLPFGHGSSFRATLTVSGK